MEAFRHITMITAIILSGVYQSAIVFAESVNCKLPTIKNADINMTGINRFSEGTVVHFHCLPGFRPVGDGLYRCANSIWVGGNFSCLIKTCPLLESPPNGEMIGDNYEIGSVMRYKCDIGFELTGSKTSLCKMDQQWHPPNAPKCRIRKCLAAPVIEHGELIPENKIEGFDYNDYGATLRARCNSGYMINGPVRIYCDSKGQWTKIPECRPISCPSYPGLDAKCVRKTTLADKTLLIIFCTANSSLISAHDGTASCENSMWDDPTIRCLCDCEIKADTDFVHIENLNPSRLLRHNETLEWSCKNGATKTINDSLTCIDGSIKPQGWGCFIPSLTSIEPFDGTGRASIDKPANENNDEKVALAGWKIAVIAVGVLLGAILVIYVFRRCTVSALKDRKMTRHQAVEDSGTDQDDEPATPPDVSHKKITKTKKKLYKRHVKYLDAEVQAKREERDNKTSGTTSTPWYYCCISQRGQSSPLKGYTTSPEFNEKVYNWRPFKKKIVSTAATPDASQEEKQAAKASGLISNSVGTSSEGKDTCPGCGKPVTAADKPFRNRRYHRDCLKCKRCKKRKDVLYDHDGEPYCDPCYDRKFGKMRAHRRATTEILID